MKNNFRSIIQSAGLSEVEAEIYGTLLEIEEGTITDLAKKSGLKRATIYNHLGRIENFGLISKILRGKRHFYSATHPQRLLQLATLHQNTIKENLPRITGAYYGTGEKPKIQMFEGMDAVRDIYHETLERIKHNEELCIFTNIGRVIELFPEIPQAFKKIVGSFIYKSKVRELVLGDTQGVNYASEVSIKNKLSNYQVRIIDESMAMGDNEQFIFKDKIIFFSLQKHIFVVIIENSDLAKTHRALFDLAWQNGKTI